MELALASQHGINTLLVWKVARPETAGNGSRVFVMTAALDAEAEMYRGRDLVDMLSPLTLGPDLADLHIIRGNMLFHL